MVGKEKEKLTAGYRLFGCMHFAFVPALKMQEQKLRHWYGRFKGQEEPEKPV